MAQKPAGMDKAAQDRRYRWIAWGAFLLMWGGTLLAGRYTETDLRNFQYIFAGLILVGLNIARYFSDIPMSRLTVGIGFLALFGGLVREITGELAIIPVVLIAAGAFILAQSVTLVPRRK